MYILETISSYFNVVSGNTKQRLVLNESLIHSIQKKLYVISLKTTGPSMIHDSITCIDIAKFQDEKLVNHLMIEVNFENEEDSILQTAVFLEEVLDGKAILYISNTSFELDLLTTAFERYHIPYHFKYLNLLTLSRKYLKGLDDFKQTRKKIMDENPMITKSIASGKLIFCSIND